MGRGSLERWDDVVLFVGSGDGRLGTFAGDGCRCWYQRGCNTPAGRVNSDEGGSGGGGYTMP